MITDHFPPLGPRLNTPRLELRLPSYDDLSELARVAAEGVHDPGAMPFVEPWTDQPPDERALSVVRYNLGRPSEWTPQKWDLDFVVVHEGALVGVQDRRASDCAVTRQVGPGSWLGRAHQGKGVGAEMRAAVLHLAFAEPGARTAVSGPSRATGPLNGSRSGRAIGATASACRRCGGGGWWRTATGWTGGTGRHTVPSRSP